MGSVSEATATPDNAESVKPQIKIPRLTLSDMAADEAKPPCQAPPESDGAESKQSFDMKPPRRLASLPAQPKPPQLKKHQGVPSLPDARPVELAPLEGAMAPYPAALNLGQRVGNPAAL